MSSVEWLHPTTVEQALAALAQEDSRAVAGGTTLLDLLKLGHPVPTRFIDISRLPLDQITETPSSFIIGAMASNTAVAKSDPLRAAFPALSQAILSGASQQIRNAASVGGNIMQATRCPYFRTPGWPCNRRHPGSGCEALQAPGHSHAILGTSANCISVHPSDMVVALLALDAVIHAQTLDGEIEIPIASFYLEPGSLSGQETALPKNALITAVEIPRSDAAKRSGYLKLRGRASYEFATVSVVAALHHQAGRSRTASIALGGMAPKPWRRVAAENLLVDLPLDTRTIDRFCDALLEGADLRPETEHKLALARGAIHRILLKLVQP